MSKDVKKRWSNNGKQYSKCPYFYRAILKYSWDSFEHVVLKDCLTKLEAQRLEKKLIQQYQTRNPEYGYNIAKGGTGGITCRDGEHPSSKKVYQYNLDGTFIREWENAQRASEELHICVSDIHATCRENNGVRQAGHYIWTYHDQDCVDKYVRLTGSRDAILQIDDKFNIVQRYDCISYVDDNVYNRERVTNCCMRKSLTHKGYYWCYEKDFDSMQAYISKRIDNLKFTKKYANSKHVYQCDQNNNVVAIFNSAKDVEEKIGINRNTIQAYCYRGMNNYGFNSTGFYWRYAIDMPQTNEILNKVV